MGRNFYTLTLCRSLRIVENTARIVVLHVTTHEAI
jgi:hypothetical protein